MLAKVLKQLKEFKTKTNRYPSYIEITKRNYMILKYEIGLIPIDKINEEIRVLYEINFSIKGGNNGH